MKSLETLIKVHQQELDEKRQEITSLEEEKVQLKRWAAEMEKELQTEREFVAQNPHLAITYDRYRKTITQRQKNMRETLVDIDARLFMLREQLAQLFGEVKKYELILDRKRLEATKERQARETKTLDEIAMNQFLRQDDAQ